MTSLLLAALAAAAALYAGVCLVLWLAQGRLMYFPQPRRHPAPTQSFETGGVALQLSVRPRDGPGAVLYFGGNGEDVSGSLGPLAAMFPDREIVMLHYRGYGGSAGRPGEREITQDAQALFDRVHAAHPDVVVVGRSLGSGVAVRLASTRPVARLVLVTPYDSLLEIAVRQFRAIPVRWLLRDRYESWRYAPHVTAPTLILAAEHDELIPADSTARLRTRFREGGVTWVVVRGASHNTIADEPAYASALARFMAAPGETPG